jgi:hypothetical protein
LVLTRRLDTEREAAGVAVAKEYGNGKRSGRLSAEIKDRFGRLT